MRLWDFALSLYARPGVEGACLTLQDDHGQCVPLLLWRLWALGRRVDPATLRTAVVIARDWDARAAGALRTIRRGLAAPAPPIADEARVSVREAVKAAELAAERALLETLEAMTPRDGSGAKTGFDALRELTDAGSRPAPIGLLNLLAEAAASVTGWPTVDRGPWP